MTTTETALDVTTLAIEQVADILSGHAVFQDAVKKYSAPEAREHIHKGYHNPPDMTIAGPFANIFESAGATWERRGDGTVLPKGEIFLHLWLNMEATDDPDSEERRFNNFHGQLVKALAEYNGPGYRLTPTLTDPPAHTHPKDQEAQLAMWDVGYTIAWSCL